MFIVVVPYFVNFTQNHLPLDCVAVIRFASIAEFDWSTVVVVLFKVISSIDVNW